MVLSGARRMGSGRLGRSGKIDLGEDGIVDGECSVI